MIDLAGVEEAFIANIKGKNIIWYKKKSVEVLKDWSMPVDGVFIDAEHTTKGITEDAKWIKHVKIGGIIAFHDYGCWPDVTAFVDKNIVPVYRRIGRERFLIIFEKGRK